MASKPLITCLLFSLALHIALLALPRPEPRQAVPPARAVVVGLHKAGPTAPIPAAAKPVPTPRITPATTAPQPAIPAAASLAEPEPAPAPPRAQSPAAKPVPKAQPSALSAPPAKEHPQGEDKETPARAVTQPALPPAPAPVADPAATGASKPAQMERAPVAADIGPTEDKSALSTPPAYLHTPHPAYPRQARQRGWEGEVLLRVRVGSGGKVLEASLERSSGHQVLDRSALEGVRAWRFRPATRDGVPVEGEVRVPIRFSLQQS